MAPIDPRILGVWKLISITTQPLANPDAPAVKPFGDDVFGRLHLGPDGYMSAMLTSLRSADPANVDKDWLSLTAEQIASVARTMISYCGTYKAYEEDGVPVFSTDVEVALDPTWIGTAQVRKWTLDESAEIPKLHLQPTQIITLPGGHQVVMTLSWEKA